MNSAKLDLIIFGATGFTGQYVVEEVARTIGKEGGLTWGVAGRNMSKLQAVIAEASQQTGENLEELPIIIADVASETSIREMCERTKCVLNCVGPYQLYGEVVVKTCIDTGTHHIDICGEPAFLEKMQVQYHEKAKEAGVYILQSCGFDSIPCDMGVVFTQQQAAPGDVNDVESYFQLKYGAEGGVGNIGTWQSAVLGFANAAERARYRRQLCAKPLPKSQHKIKKRPGVFYSNDVNSWCIPFIGADRSIVTRSQRYMYESDAARPVQFNAFMRLPSILAIPYLALLGIIFGLCVKTSFGRWLLIKYPRVMSLGLFSSQGPTRKQIKTQSFNMTFIANAHSTAIGDAELQHEDKPDRRIVTRVSGPEIGYDTTPICMAQAAYVLLKDSVDALPKPGGVFTPAAAFRKTNLIQRLETRNVCFKVLEKN